MSLSLGLSDFFLLIRLRLSVLKRILSHHIISGGAWNPQPSTGNVQLGHLAKVMLARLPHCEVTVFPFPYSFLWNRVTKSSPQSKRRGEDKLHLLEGLSIYLYYLKFLLTEDLFLFLYLFIQLFLSNVLMYFYFIPWVINQHYVIYLFIYLFIF